MAASGPRTGGRRDDGAFLKRSVVIAGHRTSISLEAAFWSALRDLAEARRLSVNQLVETIDAGRTGNLSSAIRVFVLTACRAGELDAGSVSDSAAGS
jgi:predicted DNA-binding ribbon-helix-helix protein